MTRSILLALLLVTLAACGDGGGEPLTGTPTTSETGLSSPVSPPSSVTASSTPAPSDTPVLPTETPVPLAALVNGEAITLAEFQAELGRFQAAMTANGTILATEEATILVLDELVNQVLLSQGARENGFVVDADMLQARIDAMVANMQGTQELTNWMTAHGYDEMGLRLALGRAISAAWMRDQIAASVPEVAEQVHARQILLYNSEEANQIYNYLLSGQDFGELAAAYNPLTGGDLGWFPRGYLTLPALEEAAFRLQEGEFSQVIETVQGYHIIQVIERDSQHVLTPDARRALQALAVLNWLAARHAQSSIQVYVP